MSERVIDRRDVTVRDVLQKVFDRNDYEVDIEVLKWKERIIERY